MFDRTTSDITNIRHPMSVIGCSQADAMYTRRQTPDVTDVTEVIDVTVVTDVTAVTDVIDVTVVTAHLLVRRPETRRHREVEVDAGNRLHRAAVAVAEAAPVRGLHPRDVGGAVARQRYRVGRAQPARHAGVPEAFVADARRRECVDVGQALERGFRRVEGRRHELEQRLGEVGRDELVGQRRAERARMRRRREPAVGADAQRLLFEARQCAVDQRDTLSVEGDQSLLQGIAHVPPVVQAPIVAAARLSGQRANYVTIPGRQHAVCLALVLGEMPWPVSANAG